MGSWYCELLHRMWDREKWRAPSSDQFYFGKKSEIREKMAEMLQGHLALSL